MSIPVVDWNDNEQVVRAYFSSTGYTALTPAPVGVEETGKPETCRWAIGFGLNYYSSWLPTIAEAWESARQHPSVQAYEAIHNPAKRPAEKVQDGGFEAWWERQPAAMRYTGMLTTKDIGRNAWDAALASHAQGETVTWRVEPQGSVIHDYSWSRALASTCATKELALEDADKWLQDRNVVCRIVRISITETVVAERKAGA